MVLRGFCFLIRSPFQRGRSPFSFLGSLRTMHRNHSSFTRTVLPRRENLGPLPFLRREWMVLAPSLLQLRHLPATSSRLFHTFLSPSQVCACLSSVKQLEKSDFWIWPVSGPCILWSTRIFVSKKSVAKVSPDRRVSKIRHQLQSYPERKSSSKRVMCALMCGEFGNPAHMGSMDPKKHGVKCSKILA